MQRRRFLFYLLLAPAVPVFLVGGLSGCGNKVASCLVKFSDSVLGKAAANKHLSRKLPDAWLQVCEADVAQLIRQQVEIDFAEYKTVKLDGWIVSETEALIHRTVYSSTTAPSTITVP